MTIVSQGPEMLNLALVFLTIDDFAFQWVDDHRESIALWEYERYFDMVIVNDGMIYEFLDYGGYGLMLEDLPSDQLGDLELMLKAAIAKNIWGFDAYTFRRFWRYNTNNYRNQS